MQSTDFEYEGSKQYYKFRRLNSEHELSMVARKLLGPVRETSLKSYLNVKMPQYYHFVQNNNILFVTSSHEMSERWQSAFFEKHFFVIVMSYFFMFLY